MIYLGKYGTTFYVSTDSLFVFIHDTTAVTSVFSYTKVSASNVQQLYPHQTCWFKGRICRIESVQGDVAHIKYITNSEEACIMIDENSFDS